MVHTPRLVPPNDAKYKKFNASKCRNKNSAENLLQLFYISMQVGVEAPDERVTKYTVGTWM